MSFEGNIKPTLDALQGHLGLSDDELRKMVRTLPAIIGCSFEGNIKPTLDAVQGHLGLSDDELRKMVLNLPAFRRLVGVVSTQVLLLGRRARQSTQPGRRAHELRRSGRQQRVRGVEGPQNTSDP